MHLLPRRAVIRSIRRRSVSAGLLAVYAVTAAGVPLPGGIPPKQTNERFPCEHCQCGCRTAEQCWRSCCCHTLAERFEWARENSVRPPDFAIAEARLAGIDLSWLGIKSSPRCVVACPACCSHAAANRRPSCCQSHAACCERASHSCCIVREKRSSEKQDNRVVGWRVLNCQGNSSLWLAAVPPMVNVHTNLGASCRRFRGSDRPLLKLLRGSPMRPCLLLPSSLNS